MFDRILEFSSTWLKLTEHLRQVVVMCIVKGRKQSDLLDKFAKSYPGAFSRLSLKKRNIFLELLFMYKKRKEKKML